MGHLMNYRITWEPQGVYIQVNGIMTFEEGFLLFEKLIMDDRFNNKYYRIYNLLSVRHIEYSLEAAQRHGAISKASSSSIRAKKCKIALVARDLPLNRTLFSSYKKSVESSKIMTRFFNNVREARRWAENHHM